MIIYQAGALSIHRLLLNELKTNCYILQRGDQAILVDPTDQPEQILAYLHEHKLKLQFMLSTHAHFDHISAAAGMIDSGLVDTLYLHELDLDEAKRAQSYSLMLLKRKMRPAKTAAFSEALIALLLDWGLTIRHVGAHTKGSCIFHSLNRDFIITGDLALHHKLKITLFDSRENKAEFLHFLQSIIPQFRPDTVILPGHGDRSTVEAELAHNKKWAHILQRQGHGS